MIDLDGLTLGYSGSDILISGVDVKIGRGELVSLLGRNGSGKSTLMRAIAGLSRPRAGVVRIDGVDMDEMSALERARSVSFVTTERIRIPNLSCETLVALGRTPYTNWLGNLRGEDRDIVSHSLEQVGMIDFANRSCDRLSDGELQRVMIARALAQQTPVIMLDEPTAFLDMPSRYSLMHLLRRLVDDDGKTLLYSTHELNMALDHSDLVALISTPHLHVLTPEDVVASGIIGEVFGIEI